MCVLHSIYTCISQHIALVYFVYMIRNDTATCSTCAVATFIDLYWKCQWTSSVKIWENILQYGNNKYNNFLIFFINKLNLKELSILFLTEGKSILMFHVNNIQFGQELKILLGHFWASKMLIMWPFTKYTNSEICYHRLRIVICCAIEVPHYQQRVSRVYLLQKDKQSSYLS